VMGLFIAVSDLHDFARIIEGVVVFVVVTALGVRTARSSIKWNRQGVVGRGQARCVGWPGRRSSGSSIERQAGWGLDCTMVGGCV